MKHFLLITIFIFICDFTFASNNLAKIIPSNIPNSVSYSKEEKKNLDNIIIYHLYDYAPEEFKEHIINDEEYMLPNCLITFFKTHNNISIQDLSALLNSDEEFITERVWMDTVDKSYKKIKCSDSFIGETLLKNYHVEMSLFSRDFIYQLEFIDGQRIIHFALEISIQRDDKILSQFPDLLCKNNQGWWCWQNGNSVYEFYKLLQNHDKRLPNALLEFQSAWEYIIKNLEVDGKKVEFDNRMVKLPDGRYDFKSRDFDCVLSVNGGNIKITSSDCYCKFQNAEYIPNHCYLTFLMQRKDVYGFPSYTEYDFPATMELCIRNKDFSNYRQNNSLPDADFIYGAKSPSQAMAVCAVKIRQEPNLKKQTKILGKLERFQTVTVIDATDKYDNIDGLKSRWYKIKVAGGQYGWVYGGYVKIYVDEQSKQQLLKAFAEPGSEDTNNQKILAFVKY